MSISSFTVRRLVVGEAVHMGQGFVETLYFLFIFAENLKRL